MLSMEKNEERVLRSFEAYHRRWSYLFIRQTRLDFEIN